MHIYEYYIYIYIHIDAYIYIYVYQIIVYHASLETVRTAAIFGSLVVGCAEKPIHGGVALTSILRDSVKIPSGNLT